MKKLFKKTLVLFAALMAAFAVATPAFAAGSITIANPGNETYSAYKVFDAALNNSTNKIEYTIKSSSDWYQVVTDDDVEGLEFILVDEDEGIYRVTERPGFDAAKFAEYLKDNIPTNATPMIPDANYVIKGQDNDLADGYYLVVSYDSNNAMQTRAMLTTVLDNNVTIQNKNDMPLDKTYSVNSNTEQKKEGDVQIGDVLHYTLSGKVPDTTGFESYAYVMSDEMSEGLTFHKNNNNSFNVTVAGVNITDSFLIITDENALTSGNSVLFTDTGFKLSIAIKQLKTIAGLESVQVGDPIVVTYSATVNENASAKLSWNRAVLKYSNNPNTDDLTVKDTETVAYTSSIQVDKFELGAPEQKLSGARFVLKKTENNATTYYKYDESSKNVTWVSNQADATEVTTNTNGFASFIGLKNGTYELVETAAPTGYVPLQESVQVVVDGRSALTVGITDAQVQLALTKVANIGNTPGNMLPSTGGMGTTLFYAASAVLLVIIVKRFARNDQNQTA